jgi:hypothetical protein
MMTTVSLTRLSRLLVRRTNLLGDQWGREEIDVKSCENFCERKLGYKQTERNSSLFSL